MSDAWIQKSPFGPYSGGASRWSVPGKCLLMGEYAVLVGGSAIVLAVPPAFHLELNPSGNRGGSEFHPDSPAGRLLADHQRLTRYQWLSPPRPGWGSSTAEFAATFAMLAQTGSARAVQPDWRSVHRAYRALHTAESVPPSGADLVAQWSGGVGVFSGLPEAEWSPLPWFDEHARAHFSLFSASHQEGRKTPTHVHLARLAARLGSLRSLAELSDRAVGAFRQGDWWGLGALVQAWVAQLEALEFVHPATRADQAALKAVSGVWGVKGCGAMLSDAIWVVHAPEAQGEVRRLGESRGLEWVPIPVSRVPGIEAMGMTPEG